MALLDSGKKRHPHKIWKAETKRSPALNWPGVTRKVPIGTRDSAASSGDISLHVFSEVLACPDIMASDSGSPDLPLSSHFVWNI
jgi:hypothetical protein